MSWKLWDTCKAWIPTRRLVDTLLHVFNEYSGKVFDGAGVLARMGRPATANERAWLVELSHGLGLVEVPLVEGAPLHLSPIARAYLDGRILYRDFIRRVALRWQVPPFSPNDEARPIRPIVRVLSVLLELWERDPFNAWLSEPEIICHLKPNPGLNPVEIADNILQDRENCVRHRSDSDDLSALRALLFETGWVHEQPTLYLRDGERISDAWALAPDAVEGIRAVLAATEVYGTWRSTQGAWLRYLGALDAQEGGTDTVMDPKIIVVRENDPIAPDYQKEWTATLSDVEGARIGTLITFFPHGNVPERLRLYRVKEIPREIGGNVTLTLELVGIVKSTVVQNALGGTT